MAGTNSGSRDAATNLGQLGNLISHALREVGKRPTHFCYKTALTTIVDHFGQVPVSQWKDYFGQQEKECIKKGFVDLKYIYIERYHGILPKGGGAGVKNQVMQNFVRLFSCPVTFPMMQFLCVKLYETKLPCVDPQQMHADLGEKLSNVAHNKLFGQGELAQSVKIPPMLVKYYPGAEK